MELKDYLNSVRELLDELQGQNENLAAITQLIKKSNYVYLAGNGGSAAIASHLAQGLFSSGIRASCLTDNVPILTSLANDEGYDQVFTKQVVTMHKNDLVVLFSVSGKSSNLLELTYFPSKVGILGNKGGHLARSCKKSIIFSSNQCGPVEDVFGTVAHILVGMVR